MKRPALLPDQAFASLQLFASGPARTSKPVNDEIFRGYMQAHQYERTDLDGKMESIDDSSTIWTRETVSFRAAYNDRVIAHLFKPKRFTPPYQVVVVLGGLGINQVTSIDRFRFPFEFRVQSGRAVVIPAYAGTLERGPSIYPMPAIEEVDRSLKWSLDLSRTVDYLETRPETFDAPKLGFYGVSWGAAHAPRLLAVDKRFDAAALVSGGLMRLEVTPASVDAWNFAPRYTVPTLMVNGKHDNVFPLETNQQLLFNMLGTKSADKRFNSFDGGHANLVTLPDQLGAIIDWFDKYLGNVRELPVPSR